LRSSSWLFFSNFLEQEMFFGFLRLFFPSGFKSPGMGPWEGGAERKPSAMSVHLPRCAVCNTRFRPDRYNVHRQKCCTRPDCVRERRRQRQRVRHAKRYAEDRSFAAAARRRAGPEGESSLLRHVVVGMLSQLTDTADPVQLRACMRDYAARGRRVALAAPSGTDPP